MISDLKKKGDSAASIAKTTDLLNEKEKKDKDKQIEQLRKDAEAAALKNKVTELEREKKAADIESKKRHEELDPEVWLKQHPDRPKVEALIKREAKKEAKKIIEQKKKDKKKALEALEKKNKTDE